MGRAAAHSIGDVVVLVTGFEPFGHTPINPAQLVAERLDGTSIDGVRMVGMTVPNSFGLSVDTVCQAIERERPEIVVMLGEFGGRAMITAERLALNFDDSARYGLADNAGVVRNGTAADDAAPPAYFTTLPLRAMVTAMRAAGVPADISDTPGTFVCNHLLFGVLHHLASSDHSCRAGWLHLPHLPEVAALEDHLGAPSMSLDVSTVGVTAAIHATLANQFDIDDRVTSQWQI
jgi:pyroglutamyl-peptidase